MIPILSVAEVRQSEKYTMDTEPISSIDLMERAGKNFTHFLLNDEFLPDFEQVFIFCGPGNNGGDGLVIARHLSEIKKVTVILVCFNLSYSPEFDSNLERLEGLKQTSIISFDNWNQQLPSSNAICIDALFGIGLNRPLDSKYSTIIDLLNNSTLPVIAVDVPSGLFCDKHTPNDHWCVRADKTYTFQFLKTAFLLSENDLFTGEISLIDIGLKIPKSHLSKQNAIDRNLLKQILKVPSKYAHKGSNGHGFLIAGSKQMPGAGLLSAAAAMRSGIGKVTLHAPSAVLQALSLYLPESLQHADENPDFFTKFDSQWTEKMQALAIGPGIGTHSKTVAAVKEVLHTCALQMVLDADALNILSQNKTWLTFLPNNTILTPHFKEFERLTRPAENDFDRLKLLSDFAIKNRLIVVLKGAHTVIALNDGSLFFNLSGNPGLATAGTGDVLTGIILSLLAQQYPPAEAAIAAVYIHGIAADFAINQQESTQSLIASDLFHFLGKAFKSIYE